MRSLILIVLLVAVPGLAEDPTPSERFLIPVSVTALPGANGSVWSTELWYRNNSDFPVAVFPLAVSDWVPSVRHTHPLRIAQGAPGQFLFVTAGKSDAVQFDLRLFNRTDPQSNWGVKLPVVHESRFAPGPQQLIRIPADENYYRAALRVYGLPEDGPALQSVIVRLYDQNDDLLATAQLPFDAPAFGPRYAQILVLTDKLDFTVNPDAFIRAEVEAVEPSTRIWAFVSVTANAGGQRVSIVTPD